MQKDHTWLWVIGGGAVLYYLYKNGHLSQFGVNAPALAPTPKPTIARRSNTTAGQITGGNIQIIDGRRYVTVNGRLIPIGGGQVVTPTNIE